MDCLDLVLAVAVTAANMQDWDAAVPLFERLRRLYLSVRLVWADGGYAGRLVDWAAENLHRTLETIRRSDDTTGSVMCLRPRVSVVLMTSLTRSGGS
ncbi:transposase [Streptomyces sp. NBC_00582]|uniref:transposase n=1 Tax=Streptomyces sp. NBC_00582 TaxID=2975783 RepID=UPI003FCDD20C